MRDFKRFLVENQFNSLSISRGYRFTSLRRCCTLRYCLFHEKIRGRRYPLPKSGRVRCRLKSCFTSDNRYRGERVGGLRRWINLTMSATFIQQHPPRIQRSLNLHLSLLSCSRSGITWNRSTFNLYQLAGTTRTRRTSRHQRYSVEWNSYEVVTSCVERVRDWRRRRRCVSQFQPSSSWALQFN